MARDDFNSEANESEAADDRRSDQAAAADAAVAGQSNSQAHNNPTVAQLQAEVDDLKDRLLRSQAEVENVRRRGQREMQETRKFATQPLLLDLLPVLDNMERAIASAEQDEQSGGLLEGVKMVRKQFAEALQKHHCERVPAEGQEFDPQKHEALAHLPSEEVAKGNVALVNQHGYQLHDRVIRPAQVVVSSGQTRDHDS